MRTFVLAVFNGIFQTLTGAFGGTTAFFAWLQVFLQGYLASDHTATTGGALALGAALVVGQAVAGLITFLAVSGSAYDERSPGGLVLGTATAAVSAIFVCAYNALVSLIVGYFATLHGVSDLVLVGAVVAAFQAVLLVLTLNRLVARQ